MKRRDFLGQTGAGLLASVAGAGITGAAEGGERIKIGMIGTAHAHAHGKMSTLRAQADTYEVVGIVEPDEERRREAMKNEAYADLRWMSEEELFATPGIEAVAVETAVRDLVPTAGRAIAAGLHLHLDKPAGPSLPLFRQLLESAARRKRVVQLGYMLRSNPAFQLLYRAAREGALGEIMEIDCMMGKIVSDRARDKLSEFDGGGMFELGGHLIDSIVYLLGKPEKVTPYLKRTRPERDRFADNCLAVLQWEKATATVRVNLRDPHGFPRRRFQVAGDRGALEIAPLESGKVTLSLSSAWGDFDRGTHSLSLKREGGRYDEEFLAFARAIRGKSELAWNAEHDLAVHEALLLASGMSVD